MDFRGTWPRLLILNYHRLDDAQDSGPFVVPYREIESQLSILQEAQINVAPANAFDGAWDGGRVSLMVTVDDGCKTDLQLADLLQRHGLSGIFFVSTAKTGQPGYLDQDELRVLKQMGMKIGSHGHRHIGLTKLTLQEAEQELRMSKNLLESWLGSPVDHFAFPGGLKNSSLIKLAHDAGYGVLMTTEWGSNRVSPDAEKRVLKRTNVTRGMSEADFLTLARLDNDWSRVMAYQVRNAAHAVLPTAMYSAARSWINRVTHH